MVLVGLESEKKRSLGFGLALLVLAVCKSSGVLVNQKEHPRSSSNTVTAWGVATSANY